MGMDILVWIVQILLACVFLYAGFRKLLACRRRENALGARLGIASEGLPRGCAGLIGLVEIVGALALLMPFDLWAPGVLQGLAAAGFALLMVAASIHRFRREQSAAPVVALFLLALFVVVGRWM